MKDETKRTLELAGHKFWLERNGHGARFKVNPVTEIVRVP